ncbi:MAG: DMT family transporter [Actinomycetes bacterium]
MTTAAPTPGAIMRPPLGDLLFLGVGVAAVSTSGPLIAAAAAAPALAIAFWRNALGAGLTSPFTLVAQHRALRALTRREWLVSGAAGLLLAAHFALWIPALGFTSVASGTALTAVQPIWAALIARAAGHRVPARAWLGMAIAFGGVVLLTGVDVSISPRGLVGDVMALAGGVFAAAYMTVGGLARRTVPTGVYTMLAYTACALALLLACLVGGARLGGYPSHVWIELFALTLGPQLLGHTVFNRVLRTTSATVVSLAILLEVPGAGLIAWVWLGQHPPVAAFPAAVLLLVGIGVVVTADRSVERDTEGARLAE